MPNHKQTMDSSAREEDTLLAESGNSKEVAVAGSVGPFETYFMNTENVAENKRLPYIMMMYAALGFDVETVYPYSEILTDTTNSLAGGGWKKSLKPTKELMAHEILRQNPNARLNIKNVKLHEFALRIEPLTDSRDVDFVMKEEKNIRQKLYEMLGADYSQDAVINKDVVAKPRTVVKVKNKNIPIKTVNKRTETKFSDGGDDIVSLYMNKRQKKGPNQSHGDPSRDKQCLFPTASILSTAAAEQTLNAAIKFSELRGSEWKVTVVVVDAGGAPVVMKRLDNSPPISYEIALGRARNAARFNKRTSEIEMETKRVDEEDQSCAISSFISKSGGCPILVGKDNKCIGAVGVSGAPTCSNDGQAAEYSVSYIRDLYDTSSNK